MAVIPLKKKALAKDRDLIERMEALEELINWLESKNDIDMDAACELSDVAEEEVEQWLQDPKLEKVRKWLEDT